MTWTNILGQTFCIGSQHITPPHSLGQSFSIGSQHMTPSHTFGQSFSIGIQHITPPHTLRQSFSIESQHMAPPHSFGQSFSVGSQYMTPSHALRQTLPEVVRVYDISTVLRIVSIVKDFGYQQTFTKSKHTLWKFVYIILYITSILEQVASSVYSIYECYSLMY